MKVRVVHEIEIPMDHALIPILKEKAILVLKGRRHRLSNEPVPQEIVNRFMELTPMINEIMNPLVTIHPALEPKLAECQWESNDILTTEEQAAILAPVG